MCIGDKSFVVGLDLPLSEFFSSPIFDALEQKIHGLGIETPLRDMRVGSGAGV